MRLETGFDLDHAPHTVWELLADPAEAAQCVTGVEVAERRGQEGCLAFWHLAYGPFRRTQELEIERADLDEEELRLTYAVHAHPSGRVEPVGVRLDLSVGPSALGSALTCVVALEEAARQSAFRRHRAEATVERLAEEFRTRLSARLDDLPPLLVSTNGSGPHHPPAPVVRPLPSLRLLAVAAGRTLRRGRDGSTG